MFPCVHGGARVSLSVGHGTPLPGAQAGGQIAPWRLPPAPRLLKARAIDCIVAWRIHHRPRASRAAPAGSCEVVCEPREWHPLSTMPQHCPPPPPPPPLRAMVRSLAPLGGVLARQRDGEPGTTVIWQGYPRRHEGISAVATYRTVKALERNV